MKQKVFNVIKPLLANKGLGKEELESLAEIAAKNLTTESTDEEIQNVANSLIPYAELMQKAGNRMASAVENKYKGWVDPKTIEQPKPTVHEPPAPSPQAEPKPTMTKEEIQQMIAEQIKSGIAEGLKPYQQKEEQTRLRNLLYANEKVKAIPESFRSHYAIEKEEDVENVASRIESDFTQMKQDLIKSGEFSAPPASAIGGDTDDLIEKLKEMGERATKK